MIERNWAPALLATRITKRYGDVTAVDDVTLRVERGEVVTLLGENGSGKTTLLECIEGLRRPDAGRVHVFGHPLRAGDRRPLTVGVQLQQDALPSRIRVREALHLYARIHQVPRPDPELVTALGLDELLGQRFDALSGGQKRRTALAIAFVGRPRLVILDEPTAGLDPQGQRVVLELISRQASAGVAILSTLHDVVQSQQIADRAMVLAHGVKIADGRPAALLNRLAYDACVTVDGLPPATVAGMFGPAPIHQATDGRVLVYGTRGRLEQVLSQRRADRPGSFSIRSVNLGDIPILQQAAS